MIMNRPGRRQCSRVKISQKGYGSEKFIHEEMINANVLCNKNKLSIHYTQHSAEAKVDRWNQLIGFHLIINVSHRVVKDHLRNLQ